MAKGEVKFVSLVMFVVVVLVGVESNLELVSGERGSNSMVRCIERERKALLEFKRGLVDDHHLLSSWGSDKECCEWRGVRCSNSTAHVTAILLGDTDFPFYYPRRFRGEIGSSLVELHHLKELDLSWNDFGGSRIPPFLASIKTLHHLNLGFSNFSGRIPPELGNLTQLRTLDLGSNSLWSDNLNWLSRLSLLYELVLTWTNTSDTNWVQHALLNLPSLQTLYLWDCKLRDVTKLSPPHLSHINSSTSFSALDLSYNELTSSIFDNWLFNISANLVALDLSYNKLNVGPIPDAFGSLTSLHNLSLSGNMFEGMIPTSFRNLSHLQKLDLSQNPFGVPMDELLGNLPSKQMRWLYLSNTHLTGSISAVTLGQLSTLYVLDLSYNSLEGIISEAHLSNLHSLIQLDLSFNSLTLDLSPDWIPPFHLNSIWLASCRIGPSLPLWLRTQTNLSWIDLSNNHISGEVPKWFWNSFSSDHPFYLNLSHNQMNGTIPDLSSTFIDIIDVSSNNFTGPLPLLHPNTSVVQLSQNMFSESNISSFVCPFNNRYMSLLDLSNNKLSGTIPNCWEKMTSLQVLNLDGNNLSGEIPIALGSLSNLKTLHLRGNSLCGELPSTFKNCQFLQQLDIGGNNLSGTIPSWLGEHFSNMTYLSFRRNRFYGHIPIEICKLSQLQMLDLSGNNISGKIPECFNNFSTLAHRHKNRTTTVQIFLPYNIAIVLNYIDYTIVQWKGQESMYKNTMDLLKLIDLSSNKLVGSIPKAFYNLEGLISLNLSRNRLTGNIDSNIGEMEMLECLDLSRNQLSGGIPTSLAQLHFLSKLDLTNNNLSGKIPSGTQLQSFNESVFGGNPLLCGNPLKLCPEDDRRPSITCAQGQDMKEENDGLFALSFMQEFGVSMAFGFIIGFWGAVGSLLFKKTWRSTFFNFWNGVGDWLYVTTAILVNKFNRS